MKRVTEYDEVGGTWQKVNTNYSDRNVRFVSDKGTLTLCSKRKRTNGTAPQQYLMLNGAEYVTGLFEPTVSRNVVRYWGDIKRMDGTKEKIWIYITDDDLTISR